MTRRHIQLRKINLTSGETIDVSPGITAIVGPNNTGKSSLLRQLKESLSDHWAQEPQERTVVESYEVDFAGSADDQIDEIGRFYTRRPPGRYESVSYPTDSFQLSNGVVITPQTVHECWGHSDGLGALGFYVATYLDAEGRLNFTAHSASFDTYRNYPSDPLQILYANRDIEEQINRLSIEAFKTGITVNRYSGSIIHLHAGNVQAKEVANPQTPEYMEEINSLPLLHEQGDGMRAFVGMAMAVLTGRSPLVLIDEPEAFLHPPQARMFGRFLADYAASEDETQVIIATHSEDVISGLTSVSAANGRISLARLTREGSQNHVAQLAPSAVAGLYEDPLMKHYDMLNGLFATGVVLCEADSDCAYYRAVIDTPGQCNMDSVSEAHFTHAGGKSRIAKAAKAFRAAAVPTAMIFDIDILQNEHEFFDLINVVGGDKDIVTPLRNIIVSAIETHATIPRRETARIEIERILSSSSNAVLSKDDSKKIREATAIKTGWQEFKLVGTSLLKGDALAVFGKLQHYLEVFGVFIVEQGELECLHPEVPQSNKAQWLRDVIEQSIYETSPAIPMLQRISLYLAAEQSNIEASEQ